MIGGDSANLCQSSRSGDSPRMRLKHSKNLLSNGIFPGHRKVEDCLPSTCRLFPSAPCDFAFQGIAYDGAEDGAEHAFGEQALLLRLASLAFRCRCSTTSWPSRKATWTLDRPTTCNGR